MITSDYYINEYKGIDMALETLESLLKRAERDIKVLSNYIDPDTLSEFQQKLYLDAICSQVEFLATNGELSSTIVNAEADSFNIGSYSESNYKRQSDGRQEDFTRRYSLLSIDLLTSAGLYYRGVRVLW